MNDWGWTGTWIDIPLWYCVLYTLVHSGAGLWRYFLKRGGEQ